MKGWRRGLYSSSEYETLVRLDWHIPYRKRQGCIAFEWQNLELNGLMRMSGVDEQGLSRQARQLRPRCRIEEANERQRPAQPQTVPLTRSQRFFPLSWALGHWLPVCRRLPET